MVKMIKVKLNNDSKVYDAVLLKDMSNGDRERMGVESAYDRPTSAVVNKGCLGYTESTWIWYPCESFTVVEPMTVDEALFVLGCKDACDKGNGCTANGCPNMIAPCKWKHRNCGKIISADNVERAFSRLKEVFG